MESGGDSDPAVQTAAAHALPPCPLEEGPEQCIAEPSLDQSCPLQPCDPEAPGVTECPEAKEIADNDMVNDDDDCDELGDDVEGEDDEGDMEEMKIWDQLTPQQRARHAITGRGVTLNMLMEDGIIQAGQQAMSIDYLGQKFTANLLEDGRIRWCEENKVFSSPSAWAIHCKKIVNPMKKSGCGWASVRYKGKKLDAYKSAWLRKKRPAALTEGLMEDEDEGESSSTSGKKIKIEGESGEVHISAGGQFNIPLVPKKLSVKHSTLGKRSHLHDATSLVDCTTFSMLGKIPPFELSLSSNCLLLLDFHSHLSTSEVVGYLGGKWDPSTQMLSAEQAFPCKCPLDDAKMAATVEKEIKQDMEKQGLILVGWYHSHPKSQPDPSLLDIESQMEYQIQLKGSGESYQPSIALIISPYDPTNLKKESSFRAVWIMAPPEQRPLDYGMPMSMNYLLSQDLFLSQDLLEEMKLLVDYHKDDPNVVQVLDPWYGSTTFLDKVKGSLSKMFPRDQTDGRFLEFIHNLLTPSASSSSASSSAAS